MKNSSGSSPLGDAVTLMQTLFDQSAQFGTAMLDALSKGSSINLGSIGLGSAPSVCCEIPPPCWEPQPLGEVTSFVAPGGKATVRFRVTNCGFTPRTITFVTAKPVPGLTFSPATLNLGPMERGVVVASFEVAADAKKDFEEEFVLFVRGCRNYYLRWTIKVADCGVDMCNEVEVNDCPDMVHHWYDHFYCPRHCQDQKRDPGTITGVTVGVVTPAGNPVATPAGTANTIGGKG